MKNIIKLMSLVTLLGTTSINAASAATPSQEIAVVDSAMQAVFFNILNEARLNSAETLAAAGLVVSDKELETFIEAAKHILPPTRPLPEDLQKMLSQYFYYEARSRTKTSPVEKAYAELTKLRSSSKKYCVIISDEVIISLLEAAQYNLNECTLLYKATKSNKHGLVKALLKKGINPNEPFITGDRETYPIVAATKNLDLKMLKMLCQAGAHADVKEEGQNLCHIAAKACNHTTDPEAFREIISLLTARGADLNEISTYCGQTPLSSLFSNLNLSRNEHYPYRITHAQAVQILIDAGADVNRKVYGEYSSLKSPLFQACRFQLNSNIIGALIKAGADRSQIPQALEKVEFHLHCLGNEIYYSGNLVTPEQTARKNNLTRSLKLLKSALAESASASCGAAS